MCALTAVLLGTAAAASAATPNEFYLGLLRRGTASYEASRFTDAVKQLRIAAFGLVEAVDQYQIAQVYLTLTYEKLGASDRAREAAHRVVLAERVQRKYSALPLPAAVRTAFEAAAGRLLSATESAVLLRSPQTRPSTSQPTPSTIPPPQTSTSEKIASRSATPVPQPEKSRTVKAVPQTTKPSQAATTPQPPPASPPAKAGGEAGGRGGPVEPARPATAAPAPRTLSASEVSTRLVAGDRALNAGNLKDAQHAYRDLLGAPGLDHETLIRIAEGLYRARDFSGTLSAFDRAGTLRPGEEPYRYYIAVALYETGDFPRAKKELAAVLPHIEVTPDVARYRIKIESAK